SDPRLTWSAACLMAAAPCVPACQKAGRFGRLPPAPQTPQPRASAHAAAGQPASLPGGLGVFAPPAAWRQFGRLRDTTARPAEGNQSPGGGVSEGGGPRASRGSAVTFRPP